MWTIDFEAYNTLSLVKMASELSFLLYGKTKTFGIHLLHANGKDGFDPIKWAASELSFLIYGKTKTFSIHLLHANGKDGIDHVMWEYITP